MQASCFNVTIDDSVAEITFTRPDELNSMTADFWHDLPKAVAALSDEADVRVLIISSTGKHFTAGMDLGALAGLQLDMSSGTGRARAQLMRLVTELQDSFSCLESARFPVIAAVQGGCIGGGVDLVSACDMRYATRDAFFSIHEINLAMTADVGTFPRLQRLIPEGIAREMAYTGERLSAERAAAIGLVNKVLDDYDSLLDHCRAVAHRIAAKSPLAIWGSKECSITAATIQLPTPWR
jgi:enoyl-CoA hydratase